MILDRASAKLDRNLDIVRLLKRMRKVDILSRVVLSDPKRHLSSATKQAIVSTNQDDEQYSDSENEDFRRIPASPDSELRNKIGQAFKSGESSADFDARYKLQFSTGASASGAVNYAPQGTTN
ncbi:hypothetical protein FGO68_gene14991 [Halteria grandinella]|uniref:Uncharacterized protein n=1 Tax=Halteria grandinella TaxID=5974 RepID=A0A8J8NCC2_HALGN|nr:hypothetical protein FGO68_gene14991 [Halteria grandinella]